MGDFRELRVWQRAHDLALQVHRSTASFPSTERYGLSAQMRRAAVSVVSNIAEGCGRQHDPELAYYLRVARGSARELECQLLLARDLSYLTQAVWSDLDGAAQDVSRMLVGLIHKVRSRKPAAHPGAFLPGAQRPRPTPN